MIKAVLFDLDGTLLNTMADLAAAANSAAKKCGYAPKPISEFNEYIGHGTEYMLSRVTDMPKNSEAVKKVKAEFRKYYGEHYSDNTVAYDGMVKVLDTLKNMGIKLGVVTNKLQEMTVRLIKENFGDRFDTVWGDDGVTAAKPDPERAVKAAAELCVKPDQCLFVGDSDVDMFLAQNFGAHSVGASWGFRTKKELVSSGAEFIADTPDDIISAVTEVNNAQ